MDESQQLTRRSIKKYVGIPYEVMNCWDLAKTFYSEILETDLKHYFDIVPSDRETMKNLIFTNIGDFKKVDGPSFGDLILMKMHGVESHIGIYIGDNYFLHTLKGSGSVIDRLSKWETAISGYYRSGGAA